MATRTGWTIADYLALDEPDGPHFELSDGELIVTPSTTFNHNKIRRDLEHALVVFTEAHRLGMVTSETDFQLGPATIRRPDVAFIRADRFLASYGDTIPIPIAPDLAFEIISPSERPGAMRKRLKQYLAAGTLAVWHLFPAMGTAERFASLTEDPLTVKAEAGGALTEPEVLPGFSLQLGTLLNPGARRGSSS